MLGLRCLAKTHTTNFIFIKFLKTYFKIAIAFQLFIIIILTSWYLILTDVSVLAVAGNVVPVALTVTLIVHMSTVLRSSIIWLTRCPTCKAQWLSTSVVEFFVISAPEYICKIHPIYNTYNISYTCNKYVYCTCRPVYTTNVLGTARLNFGTRTTTF